MRSVTARQQHAWRSIAVVRDLQGISWFVSPAYAAASMNDHRGRNCAQARLYAVARLFPIFFVTIEMSR
jgi:hypothetical protein